MPGVAVVVVIVGVVGVVVECGAVGGRVPGMRRWRGATRGMAAASETIPGVAIGMMITTLVMTVAV